MVKKRVFIREQNRKKLVNIYILSRDYYKKKFNQRKCLESRLRFHSKIQKFPRNRIGIRLSNRCKLSGRSRGYYRNFNLSRHFFRELVQQGFFPGIQKSSW
jgi:small subunit ribosomal protein S14